VTVHATVACNPQMEEEEDEKNQTEEERQDKKKHMKGLKPSQDLVVRGSPHLWQCRWPVDLTGARNR
jgi:hypothetical protein